MRRTTAGCSIVATRWRRPPHVWQARTSIDQTRRSSSAHDGWVIDAIKARLRDLRHGRQRPAQVAGRVSFRAPRRHGVAEHLPAVLHRPVRRLLRAPAFDPALHRQKLRGLDLHHRPLADPREQVLLETPHDAVTVAGHPVRREFRVPLPGDGVEAIGPALGELARLTGLPGVDPGGERLARGGAVERVRNGLTGRTASQVYRTESIRRTLAGPGRARLLRGGRLKCSASPPIPIRQPVPDSGTIPASGAPVAHRDRAGFERGMEGKPMRIPTRTSMLALAALALMAVGAQATAAQSCAKAKVPAAGKAASCRLKAAGVFLASAGGAADIEKRDAGYAKCQEKMDDAYAKADTEYGTDCAVLGDATTIDALTAVYSDDVVRLTVCGDGYSSDGQSCTDIDECATDNGGCGSGANCTNTTGSRTCECLPGYSDVDWECLDIDECSLNTDDCHANATCTNITGTYTCACDAGYSGDGQICTAVATGALWTRTTTSGQVVHLSAIPPAAVGSFIIYKSFAETTVASVEAESLTGSGTIVRHNNASGGKALRLTTTTPAITTITTLSNVTDLQLRAKGRPCAGAPRVIISTDGKQLIVVDVSLRKYQDYSAKVTLPAGQHDISAVFANPFSKSNCTRAVVLDVLKAFDNTDSLPPSVAITTPTSNAVVTGVINIGANVSDNVGVSRVDVLIDDGIVSTLTAGPYSYSWDTSSVTNGAHIIKCSEQFGSSDGQCNSEQNNSRCQLADFL